MLVINKSLVKKIILIVLLFFSFATGYLYKDSIDIIYVKNYIGSFGWVGYLIFVFIYIVFTIFLWPGSFLTILGGVLFGYVGIIINLIAATLGAICAFLISRYIFNSKNNISKLKMFSRFDRINKYIEIINNNSWQILAVLRLVPIVPFNILNYLVGFTNIRLDVYILVTFIFMLPGCVLYTYLGILGDLAIQGSNYQLIRGAIITVSMFLVLYLLIKVIKNSKTYNKLTR